MAENTLAPTWPPSLEEIEAIIALDDPVWRNWRITQTYHELTVALAAELGGTDVSWCAYATWASKSAGIFIRGENVEAAIRRYLRSSEAVIEDWKSVRNVLKWLGQNSDLDQLLLAQVLETVTEGITRNVGHGNKIVFAELAAPYRRLLDLLTDSRQYDQAALDELLSHFTAGETEAGGQDLLVQAFTLAYEARFETDPKAKAELIFFANVLVGYHEQARLQDAIVASMQEPLTEEVERVLGERLDFWMRLHVLRPVGALVRLAWRRRIRTLAVQMADDWRRISTELLMTLDLPSETLYLGSDVPPAPDGRMFPPDLETIENSALHAVLAKLDRTPDTAAGSGARDWGDLADRMNYIADFFRSRQQDGTLCEPPFSDEHVARIRDGWISEM